MEETLDLDEVLESLSWGDLVSTTETQRLQKQLSALAGGPVAIATQPPQEGDTGARPVTYQLETLAWVTGDLPESALDAAAGVLERVLYQAARYYLAANLHLEVVRRDYAALEEKHQALVASEARYRVLSGELEEQVRQQVRQIEDRQRRLYAAEKLNAVGRLGAGVAHEINNPIGFIRSNLNTSRDYVATFVRLIERLESLPGSGALMTDLDLEWVLSDFQQLTEESLDGARRIAEIVAHLRRFAGTDDQGPQWLSVTSLLEGVWAVASPRLGDKLAVDWQLDEDLPQLLLDRAAISQVFYNVLENSAQAAERPVHVTISGALEDQGVALVFSDDGDGMGPETLAHLFDPFFTTKPVGSGTGLGLTVCRDTLMGLGGDIQVSSTEGEGTRVRIWLPVTNASATTD
ncbi:MAG: ATP-binding protein [Oleiphilaceae bacterium]|nr:ATP-binding protein [Oleiphilaceae bacterium]